MQDPSSQAGPADASNNSSADSGTNADGYQVYVEEVLEIVEQIPPGRVTSYGRIAAVLGRGGPRQVGQVMATFGAEVAWWRVVRADGSLPAAKQRRARPHYLQEGTPLRSSMAVDMPSALWDPLVELKPEVS